jgi:NAD(P)-dependent dehydrogenase (short-subunit alcohol dehydrogenase family)
MSGSRRVLVTGAANGIGRATALRLRAQGSEVIAVDRDETGLADAIAAGAEGLVADLSTPEGLEQVIEAGQGVDGLVNAAGIIRLKPILEFTVSDIRDIYAINVEAVWMLSSHIGRSMPENSAIVNLSSVSARLAATTETAVYASSKAAVMSMTRSFAYAFASRGIRVNAVLPGIIDTPMQDKVLDEVALHRGISRTELESARLASVPMKRTATPDECAGLICFLLSAEAAYITGQGVGQDGGLFMW